MDSPLRLDSVLVAQQTSDSQVIGWTFLGVGAAATNAVVKVWRSYVENDGFELIATIDARTGFYRDDTVNLFDRWRFPFYKLEVVDRNGLSRTYGPYRVSSDIDGLAIALIKNTTVMLRLGGVPVLVYQRRSDASARCSNCWDATLRKVTIAYCEVCYNTGFEEGYYAPILTLATIAPESKLEAPSEVHRQTATTSALLSNYPVLRPRDLIYEVNTGRRYRIFSIQTAEKQRMLINQNITMEALNPGDVEHHLPVPVISLMTPVLSRTSAPSRSILVDNFSPENPTISRLYI